MTRSIVGSDFGNVGDSTQRSVSHAFSADETIIAIASVNNIQDHGTIQGTGWTNARSIDRTNGPSYDVWFKKATGSETDVTVDFPSSNNSLHVYKDDDTNLIYTEDTNSDSANVNSGNVNSTNIGPTGTLEDESHASLGVIATNGNPDSAYAFTDGFTELGILASELGHRLGTAWKTHSGTTAQSTTASWTTSRLHAGSIVTFSITSAATEVQKTFNLDMLINAVIEKQFSIDQMLRETFARTFSLDSILAGEVERLFNIDMSLITEGATAVEKDFSLDMIVSTLSSLEFSLDMEVIRLEDVDFALGPVIPTWEFGRPII